MDDLDSQRLMDLVGHIYETAADPQHWQEFVTLLERIYPHSRVTLFEHDKKLPGRTLKVSENYDPGRCARLCRASRQDQPVPRAGAQGSGRFPAQSEMMISDEELKTTEYYNEYVRPRRLGHYSTGMVLERSPGRILALAIADHRNDADRRATSSGSFRCWVPI